MIGNDGLAGKVAADAARRYRLPEGRDFTEGAARLLTYATTIHALVDRGRLEAGQTLLVMGEAGGVGLAAIERGKAFGARVIAAVSSDETAAEARAAGAEDTLVYGRAPVGRKGTRPNSSH